MTEATKETAAALLEIFQGRSDCYGKGKGLCVKAAVNEELIGRHLAGEVAIGVYPLTPDGNCRWVCVDLDYPGEPDLARWTRALTLAEALRRLGALPFIEKSKSKGYHVWLFFREPVEAAWARAVAAKAVADAGLPPDTEIFPKHDRLTPETPFGSYVNLPYFGPNGNGGRQMIDPASGQPLTVDEFLAALSLTDPNDVLLWRDGKPDAEDYIIAGGGDAARLLGEEAPYRTRHEKGKRVVGLLVARLWPDGEQAVLDAALNWNAARCDPPLPEAEVRRMVADFWRKEERKRAKEGTEEDGAEPEPLRAEGLDVLLADEDEPLNAIISDGGAGAVLTEDGKGFVAGPTGVGKTNLLLRLSRCLCEGTPFLDLPIEPPRRVLYVLLEGSRRAIRRRLRKVWAGAPEDAKGRFTLTFTRLDVARKADLGRLRALIERVKPDVLIIDPLRNAHSLDENASDQAAKLTALLDSLIAAYGCAIICAHHDRKRPPFVRRDSGTDRLRGSTALTGWATFCLSIETKPGNADTLLAEWTKTRDAEERLQGSTFTLGFDRETIDFEKVLIAGDEGDKGEKVPAEAVLGVVASAGGCIKGPELFPAVMASTGAGQRTARNRVREMVKTGELLETVAGEDKQRGTKTYILPQEGEDLED